jgi:mycofactocin biosynthesis protein MftB
LLAVNESATSFVDRPLELHPRAALRREPFGALVYHYDTRRLVFLRHPDVVRLVESLADNASLRATLTACDIAESRWPRFEMAIASLIESEIVRDRTD